MVEEKRTIGLMIRPFLFPNFASIATLGMENRLSLTTPLGLRVKANATVIPFPPNIMRWRGGGPRHIYRHIYMCCPQHTHIDICVCVGGEGARVTLRVGQEINAQSPPPLFIEGRGGEGGVSPLPPPSRTPPCP